MPITGATSPCLGQGHQPTSNAQCSASLKSTICCLLQSWKPRLTCHLSRRVYKKYYAAAPLQVIPDAKIHSAHEPLVCDFLAKAVSGAARASELSELFPCVFLQQWKIACEKGVSLLAPHLGGAVPRMLLLVTNKVTLPRKIQPLNSPQKGPPTFQSCQVPFGPWALVSGPYWPNHWSQKIQLQQPRIWLQQGKNLGKATIIPYPRLRNLPAQAGSKEKM